jgi:hypothetical protein
VLRCAAERWVLKSPGHLWALDALLAVYPDARIVQTHRDPLQVIASLKLFDQSYLLTGATGGPKQSGRSAVGYVYDSGFVDNRIGYASATAFLLFLVVLLVSMGWFRLVRRAEKGA